MSDPMIGNLQFSLRELSRQFYVIDLSCETATYQRKRGRLITISQLFSELLADLVQDTALTAHMDIRNPIGDFNNCLSELINDELYDSDERIQTLTNDQAPIDPNAEHRFGHRVYGLGE